MTAGGTRVWVKASALLEEIKGLKAELKVLRGSLAIRNRALAEALTRIEDLEAENRQLASDLDQALTLAASTPLVSASRRPQAPVWSPESAGALPPRGKGTSR